MCGDTSWEVLCGEFLCQRNVAHLRFLVTEGGVDRTGIFHRLLRLDDARLAEIFAREVLRLPLGQGLLSPEWAKRIFSWRYTGFNVHSPVRAETKNEAERVGKYMLKLTFIADKPPPSHVFEQVALPEAVERGDYF